MLWGEDEAEAAITLCGEPFVGLLGHMRRMIVEDDLDRRVGRVGSIELLEEADELARAVAVFDAGVNLSREQVDPRQQAQCPKPLVFVVARNARMLARYRRQVRRGVGRSPGCPASRHKRRTRRSARSASPPPLQLWEQLWGALASRRSQDGNLLINTQDFRHLGLELRIPPLQVVPHFVRLHLLLGEQLANRALRDPRQAGVPRCRAMLAA